MADIKSLGYIKIQTSDIDRWRSFAFDVLGFAQGSGPDPDALYLRMDERPARIIVVPGDTDQVVHVGWEVRDGLALQRVRETLERGGVAVKPLSVEEADARRVEDVIAFTDPTGTTTEVFFGPALDHSPVVTPFGATFVTGAQGLGHVVLPTMDPAGAFAFYTEMLGFLPRGAMRLPAPPEFGPLRIRFFGVNERHHSHGVVSCAARRGAGPGPHHGRGRLAGRRRPRTGSRCTARFFAVLDARSAYQRQDGLVLRSSARRMGHRIRHRRHESRRNLLHG